MASTSPSPAATQMDSSEARSFRGPCAIMTILFFMWGFMAVFHDVLNGFYHG